MADDSVKDFLAEGEFYSVPSDQIVTELSLCCPCCLPYVGGQSTKIYRTGDGGVPIRVAFRQFVHITFRPFVLTSMLPAVISSLHPCCLQFIRPSVLPSVSSSFVSLSLPPCYPPSIHLYVLASMLPSVNSSVCRKYQKLPGEFY